MPFVDKTLHCLDCGKEFVFTAGEQEFYQKKGFTNEPLRCKDCRDARKRSREGTPGLTREMFDAVCAKCGADRKSTRLNSSHTVISYAVFCLKKKNTHTSDGAPYSNRSAAHASNSQTTTPPASFDAAAFIRHTQTHTATANNPPPGYMVQPYK